VDVSELALTITMEGEKIIGYQLIADRNQRQQLDLAVLAE
jgi:hypothetical protein